ncbi:MAG TPA: thioredoxin fold domain-containing protein [Thermoanaerobaculia bacterium]|nr:thioredoxin fold domain-containing protein [Thermoanaerobaculia bacterium]
MKRTASIAALLALLIVPQAFASPFLKTVGAAQKKAKEKNQLIFVDLFADRCGWCHRFDKEVVPSEAFQNATKDMVLLRLDTEDGKEGSQFAKKYQISSLPTFLILDPDLAIAAVIRGYAPPDRFVEMMKGSVDKYKEFEQLVAKETMLAKDYPMRLQIAREYRARQSFDKSEQRLRKLATEAGVPAGIRDDAWLELAVLYLDQGKYDEVVKTVNEFAKVQKEGYTLERTRLVLTQAFLAQGNFKSAATELKSFKSKYPKSPLMAQVESMLPNIERMATAQ